MRIKQRLPLLPLNGPTVLQYLPKEFGASMAFLEAWKGFLEMRKVLKKPLTDYAEKLTAIKLKEMGLAKAIESLEQSICNNWTGVFLPKKSSPQGEKKKREGDTIFDDDDEEPAINPKTGEYVRGGGSYRLDA